MDYVQRQRNPTRHLAGIGFVLLFHMVLIYALVTGLARRAVEIIKQPLETRIIQEVKRPPPELPPPPPKLALPPPPVFVPPPEVNIAKPPPVAATITTTSTPPAPSAPAAVATEAHVAPVIDAKHGCQQPEYPPTARRLEQTGTTVLQFLIDVDGHVLSSRIDNSSGHTSLDEAAREALGRCKFKPGTFNGKPEQSWARIKYTWRIE